MAEIESIISAVCRTLETGTGVDTMPVYPAGAKKRHDEPVITVGLRSGCGTPAGFAEYLGERYVPSEGTYCETYGKRLELTLEVDVYSPDDAVYGAGKCLDVVSSVIASLTELQSGIRVKKFTCGETKFDTSAGMFLCQTQLQCVCTLYADRTEDSGLSAFTLRGDVV